MVDEQKVVRSWSYPCPVSFGCICKYRYRYRAKCILVYIYLDVDISLLQLLRFTSRAGWTVTEIDFFAIEQE